MRKLILLFFIFAVGCSSVIIPFSKEEIQDDPDEKQIKFNIADLEKTCRDTHGANDMITPQQRICETDKVQTFFLKADEEGLLPIVFERGVLIPPQVIAGSGSLADFQRNAILIHDKAISFKEAVINLLAVKLDDVYKLEFTNNWLVITVLKHSTDPDSIFNKSISDLQESLKFQKDLQKQKLTKIVLLGKYADVNYKIDKNNSKSVKELADHMIKENAKDKKNWWYGKVVFDANTVLGRVAMLNNKIQEANLRLLKSVELEKNSYFAFSAFQTTQLAKLLMEKKQQKTILQFLRKLKALRLPKTDADDIKFWEAEIKKTGKTSFKPSYERTP